MKACLTPRHATMLVQLFELERNRTQGWTGRRECKHLKVNSWAPAVRNQVIAFSLVTKRAHAFAGGQLRRRIRRRKKSERAKQLLNQMILDTQSYRRLWMTRGLMVREEPNQRRIANEPAVRLPVCLRVLRNKEMCVYMRGSMLTPIDEAKMREMCSGSDGRTIFASNRLSTKKLSHDHSDLNTRIVNTNTYGRTSKRTVESRERRNCVCPGWKAAHTIGRHTTWVCASRSQKTSLRRHRHCNQLWPTVCVGENVCDLFGEAARRSESREEEENNDLDTEMFFTRKWRKMKFAKRCMLLKVSRKTYSFESRWAMLSERGRERERENIPLLATQQLPTKCTGLILLIVKTESQTHTAICFWFEIGHSCLQGVSSRIEMCFKLARTSRLGI